MILVLQPIDEAFRGFLSYLGDLVCYFSNFLLVKKFVKIVHKQ